MLRSFGRWNHQTGSCRYLKPDSERHSIKLESRCFWGFSSGWGLGGGVGGSGINWRVSFFPKDSSHQQQDVLRIRASVGGASSLSFSLSLWNEDSPIDPPGILRRCFKVRPKIVLTDDPCSCCCCWTPWRILAMEVGGRGGEKERSSFFLGFSPEIDDMFSLVHRRWKRP